MALPEQFKWEAFKKATNIKGASRGKKMEKVDNALKSYWEGNPGQTGGCTPQQELANLLGVTVAVNTWIKKKVKKKQEDPYGKNENFVSRHNIVVSLGKACFAEAKRLAPVKGHDPKKLASLQYEQRKMQTTVNNPN